MIANATSATASAGWMFSDSLNLVIVALVVAMIILTTVAYFGGRG